MFAPTIGRWQTKDPKSFDAGDTNLYRFVGNHPSYATDPSGLEDPANPQSMMRFYLHPWASFPGYDSNAGNFRNSEQGIGLDTVRNWMTNDKQRAKKFFSVYIREWGDLVKQAAKANGGGQLVVDGVHNIDVPAMSEDFLDGRFDSFHRTQAQFAHFMFENGYFKFVNQELVLNW